MSPKKPSTSNNLFQTIVRKVVIEELKPIKEEFKSVRNEFKKVREEFGNEFKKVREEFKTGLRITKADILESVDEKIDNSYRKYRDDVLTGLDQVMGELKTIRQEQTMHQGQHDDLYSLPEKVENLEKIHPNGQHLPI